LVEEEWILKVSGKAKS